ncbi:TPA: SA1788 family PVL leukocidin-associated protein [Staphylococcus aureus]
MGSVVIINNKPYKFNNFEKELMAKRGINAGIVSKRVRGCWEFSEALDAPYGMRLAEYKEIVLSRIMQRESKEREIARQRRKKAELRRKKPHLFNVPQKHPRGRYACYLIENDIFVKVKK